MNIKEVFLRLTNKTYPYGTEDILVNSMIEQGILPKDLEQDPHGNYFYKIGESRTVFASHFDTVSNEHVQVVHTFDGKMIGTDKKTTLGADDKAGVAIMVHMMNNNIPGLYYFFIGEEVGCIGSGLAAKMTDVFKDNYDRIISFDRRGTDSVITHQSSRRTCSDVFADALANELNKSGFSYLKDDTGSYTDSNEFTSVIPECTNISVGYYKAHTFSEQQDIEFLTKLADACLVVDWESLPVERDMTKDEYKSYNYGYNGSYRKRNYSYSPATYKPTSRHRLDYAYYGDDIDDWQTEYDYNVSVVNDEWDNWEPEPEYKPTRRGGKKNKKKRKGKSYIDNGSGLVPFKKGSDFNVRHTRNYYDSLVDKILDDDLTTEDLEIIKDQYLDMDNANDRDFYNYLLGNIL